MTDEDGSHEVDFRRTKITGTNTSVSYNLIPDAAPQQLTEAFESIIDEIQAASEMSEDETAENSEAIKRRIEVWEEDINKVLAFTEVDYRVKFEFEDDKVFMVMDPDYVTDK